MGFVVPEGELPDASIPTDRHKSLLIDGTSADPQAKVHPVTRRPTLTDLLLLVSRHAKVRTTFIQAKRSSANAATK